MLAHPAAHHARSDPSDFCRPRLRLGDWHGISLVKASHVRYHRVFADYSLILHTTVGAPTVAQQDIAHLRAPIVLVHGVLGFDRIKLGHWELYRYFPGIEEYLRGAGNRVLTPCLSITRGVADRAYELRRFIRREAPGEKVHILAHSMGGLDARYMISRLGMEDRVLSLTTIGTPHRGTCFADWGVRKLDWLLAPAFRLFGIADRAFRDLTTEGCQRVNELAPNVPGVRYFSVAGRCEPALIKPMYWLPHRIVTDL